MNKRILFVSASLLLIGMAAITNEPKKVDTTPPSNRYYDEAHQFLFHAVLEGCYRSGLDDDDVAKIIPPIEGDPWQPDFFTNFVFSCPVCEPCYEAFRLYSFREPFAYQKREYDTFGSGLPREIKVELAATPTRRRAAIRGLITQWTDERIKQLRLNREEEEKLRSKLSEMRKEGENDLKRWQNKDAGFDQYFEYYKDWKECPICSGAASH